MGTGEKRCLWQITPRELPVDMPAMALEMWQDMENEGALHLFQFITEDRSPTWWDKITHTTHFTVAPE